MVNATKKQLDDVEAKLIKKYDDIEAKLIKKYDAKIRDMEAEFKRQLNEAKKQFSKTVEDKMAVMFDLVKTKDVEIEKLIREIAGLGASLEHISSDTAELGKKINNNAAVIRIATQEVKKVEQKATDLEDRSRRSNLVFFNIPEENRENCFAKINKILETSEIQQPSAPFNFDRAHRLGRFKPEARRPRPIIVKFTYFLDKEYVLRNASKLRDLTDMNVNVSEDFSRTTLDVHKQLATHAKFAKASNSINNFNIKYRRVVARYTLNDDKFVYKTFSLNFIEEHPTNWFSLKEGSSE